MGRSIWKGTMGFGLVTIGVELLTAEKPNDLDLDMLDRRDHARIGYQKINKTTGEVVPQSEIVRGMEIADKKYVVLTTADLKAANPKATQSVDIVAFVGANEIPRMFYDRPYYVSPLKGSEKAYGLLRDVLEATEQIGLAQIVIHTRQHMAAVYPYESALVVQLLRYANELKDPDDAGVKEVKSVSKSSRSAEFAMAEQLVSSMEDDWKPESFKDTYHDDVLKLVKQRSKKGAKVSPAELPKAESETKVLDLVSALRNSLRKGPAKKAAKRVTKTTARAHKRRSA